MRKRSLLAIATIAWVAPLSAQGPGSNWHPSVHAAKSDCPVARAKAQVASRKAGAVVRARAIAPSVDTPGEGSIFAIGRSSSVLMP
jgi:hypothetical protein